MSDNAFGLIEMAFSFGVVVAFGVWQLWSIRKTRERLRGEHKRLSEKD